MRHRNPVILAIVSLTWSPVLGLNKLLSHISLLYGSVMRKPANLFDREWA